MMTQCQQEKFTPETGSQGVLINSFKENFAATLSNTYVFPGTGFSVSYLLQLHMLAYSDHCADFPFEFCQENNKASGGRVSGDHCQR